jgi:hypothetical protein
VFSFIVSTFFGGSILMRFPGFQLSFGNSTEQQPFATDIAHLENQIQIAAEAVETIRTQIQENKCQEIYEQAHESFRDLLSQAELLGSCSKYGLSWER